MSNKEVRKKYEIQLNIKNEEDLYNSFDKFNNTLSDDLYLYILNKAEFSHAMDKLQMNIISKNKIDKEKFKQTYYNHIDEQIELNKKETKRNITKQIWMLLIGIFFIVISIILSKKVEGILDVLVNIIATIGSFSVWESTSSWLVERKKLNGQKLKLLKLKNMEMNFE